MKNLYIAFDGDKDIRYYNLLKAWKENDNIEFNFSDSHDLNNSYDWSSREATNAQLRKRMDISDALILLYGESTIKLKYVRYEIELAKKRNLPIIVVDINHRERFYSLLDTLPEILQDYDNVKVIKEFNLNSIQSALYWI